MREDVGRHNAMDKVVGRALLDGLLPLHGHVLCVSGRLSFELVQKAAVAGAPILVGVGAPTSLAVALAADRGMTLAGFARGGERQRLQRRGARQIAPTRLARGWPEGVDMAMSDYPITYTQSPPEQRSRLTVFFRCPARHPAFPVGVLLRNRVPRRGRRGVVRDRDHRSLAGGHVRLRGRLPALQRASGRVPVPRRRRVPALRRRRASRVPGPDRHRPAEGGVQPPEGVLPAILAIPVYVVQYVFSLWLFVVAIALWVVGRDHRPHPCGADRGDAPADGLLHPRQRLLLPRHRGLAAV